jgi:hypothetical protein
VSAQARASAPPRVPGAPTGPADVDGRYRFVPLAGDARAQVAAAYAGSGAAAQHDPLWLDVLADCGESAFGAVAHADGEIAGWIAGALRDGPGGPVVTSLPFVAYGGPVVVRGGEATAEALARWLAATARARGAVAVAIGLSPFTPADTVAATEAGLEANARYDNFAQVQALDPHPLRQLPKARRDTLASLVRRAERAGVVVGPSSDAAEFDDWLVIYRARYSELGARPLGDDFHRAALTRGSASGRVEFWTARQGDRLLGGSLFLVGDRVVDYFSSAFGTDPATRAIAPTNLLLSSAFHAFAARGLQWFNWQSSPGRGGVYRFKAGWGAEERPQPYVCWIAQDATELLALTPADVLREYPARFVIPFDRLAASVRGGGDPEAGG